MGARPIGVFDSGFGGLTVVRELAQALPCEDIIYFGDSARCPYGPRPQSQVREFALEISKFLVAKGCKLIVIACNTATAASLDFWREELDVPGLGVIRAGAELAVERSSDKCVGVIATTGTIQSGSYEEKIHEIDPEIRVISQATPQFVDIAEHGLRISDDKARRIKFRPHVEKVTRSYLLPMKKQGMDALVLGCTHFPLLRDLFKEVLGDEVEILLPARRVAEQVGEILAEKDIANPSAEGGKMQFYTSESDLDEFRTFGTMVLGRPIENLECIEL